MAYDKWEYGGAFFMLMTKELRDEGIDSDDCCRHLACHIIACGRLGQSATRADEAL
jgi:hypothetical protein